MEEATLEDLYRELWLRKRNQSLLVWTTKAGKSIPIKDMTDSHLVNTIKMLRRNSYDFSNSDENIWDHIGDMDPMDYYD